MRSERGIRQFAASLGVFLAVCFSMGAAPASASGEGDFDIYAAIEDFTWKEFSGGQRLLRENGILGGIGFVYHGRTGSEYSALTLTPRIEFFWGEVDYDGQACDTAGNCFPSITDTGYFGTKLEFDLGGRFGKGFVMEPFGGLGVRSWWRDIEDTAAFNPFSGLLEPVSGYTEYWTAIYLRLGLRGELAFSQTSNLFFEAAAKVPIYNENTAYLSDIWFYTDDITVEPGKKTSFFAEAGMKADVFKISVFYESLRFSESDVDFTFDIQAGSVVGFVQPKSDADIYGIRIGVSF